MKLRVATFVTTPKNNDARARLQRASLNPNKNKRKNDHYESSQRQPFNNEPITQAKRPPVPPAPSRDVAPTITTNAAVIVFHQSKLMVVKAMRALHRMTLTGTAGVPVPSSAEITRKKKWCSWGKPKNHAFRNRTPTPFPFLAGMNSMPRHHLIFFGTR